MGVLELQLPILILDMFCACMCKAYFLLNQLLQDISLCLKIHKGMLRFNTSFNDWCLVMRYDVFWDQIWFSINHLCHIIINMIIMTSSKAPVIHPKGKMLVAILRKTNRSYHCKKIYQIKWSQTDRPTCRYAFHCTTLCCVFEVNYVVYEFMTLYISFFLPYRTIHCRFY